MIKTTKSAATRTAITFLLLVAAASSGQSQFWKKDKPYPDGSTIVIKGVVSDGTGSPVADVMVDLVASRFEFKVGRLDEQVERTVKVTTRTNRDGEFSFDWVWYRYYNDFALEAGIDVPLGGEEARREVLARTELNNRIALGSPVIVPLIISDESFLEAFRGFVAHLDTDDERRVYTSMGRPDKVDALDLQDRSEEAWWYFRHGAVYRFIDGRLDEVEEFAPITP